MRYFVGHIKYLLLLKKDLKEQVHIEYEDVNQFQKITLIYQENMRINLTKYYKFQSKEEFEYFTFIEYPIEIFGHAGLSYSTTFSDLHKLMADNPQHNYTLVGLDELGKAKPGTLFFLSKNGFLGNNITCILKDFYTDKIL